MGFEILVVGAGRGGTSLLTGMLDYHPKLIVEGERFAVRDLMGDAPPPVDQLPLAAELRARRFYQSCAEQAARYPRRRWGNKVTTEQIRGLHGVGLPEPAAREVLHVFFNQVMAHVRVVFILRDGRTCVRSKMKRTGMPLENACAAWRYSVDVWRFLRDHRPDHHVVRFEELVTDAEEVLRGVCDYLGIGFDRRMLKGSRNTKLLPEYRRSGVDPSVLDESDIPAGCVELIRNELELTGYPVA